MTVLYPNDRPLSGYIDAVGGVFLVRQSHEYDDEVMAVFSKALLSARTLIHSYHYASAVSRLPLPTVDGVASGPFCARSFSSNLANSFIAISSSWSITCCTPLTSSM